MTITGLDVSQLTRRGGSVARSRHMLRVALLLSCAGFAAHCGSSSSPAGPSAADATITITSSGVSPAEVRIKAWGHVLFVNNDTRPHVVASDPVPTHSDCPPINAVGFLSPGESRETTSMHLPRTCGFHDHNNESDPTLKGRIIVQD